MIRIRKLVLSVSLLIICFTAGYGQHEKKITVSALFSDHMVLQRGKTVSVYGTAPCKEVVTVRFNGQVRIDTADSNGSWKVGLSAMRANPNGQSMSVSGIDTISIHDILVGDVWLCSGQSNMDWRLSGSDRPGDIADADFPGIRQFTVPICSSGFPSKKSGGRWTVCTPGSAGNFSAVAFYYARRIYLEQERNIPVGLILSAVGGTPVDLWLSPEGVTDIPALKPLFSQGIVPGGPFSLFNGMIYPLAPYGIKGAIWYQGENSELTKQSTDSYYLKLKGLSQGWKRLWHMDDFPFNLVLIANWGMLPGTFVPDTVGGRGWDSDTRIQQINAMALPNTGVASAMDIGDIYTNPDIWKQWHPADKLDVGDRLALWPLKFDSIVAGIVESGPVLKEVVVSGRTLICSFDYCGSGLIVGKKDWYLPVQDVTTTVSLNRFVISGANGTWYQADAAIKGENVILSSASVAEPLAAGYACWQNPLGANLYNKEGLPAAPFFVGNVHERYTVSATAGAGGTISPCGTKSLLRRTTTRYSIKPDKGFFIEDVLVDGVSAGSVKSYTFDPVYKNHDITAKFTTIRPEYTISVSKNDGGTVSPSGELITVNQGNSVTFNLYPDSTIGYFIKIDGAPVGERLSYTFSDIRENHTFNIAFSSIIKAQSAFGGSILPGGEVITKMGSNQSFTIKSLHGYSISDVIVDGESLGNLTTYSFRNVSKRHTILARFKPAIALCASAIPCKNELLMACSSSSLQVVKTSGGWPAWFPENKTLEKIANPEVVVIDGKKFSQNLYLNGEGYNAGSYASAIPCRGASVVAVVKPCRFGTTDLNWQSVVDIFYDRLVLGVMNSTGKVVVRRNGSIDYSDVSIPDGQTTILSLVVQSDGKYTVFANGSEIMSNKTTCDFTTLEPGNFKTITIGRNGPDSWTTFNGAIGDVFIYKTALTDSERIGLETYISVLLLSL